MWSLCDKVVWTFQWLRFVFLAVSLELLLRLFLIRWVNQHCHSIYSYPNVEQWNFKSHFLSTLVTFFQRLSFIYSTNHVEMLLIWSECIQSCSVITVRQNGLWICVYSYRIHYHWILCIKTYTIQRKMAKSYKVLYEHYSPTFVINSLQAFFLYKWWHSSLVSLLTLPSLLKK